MLELSNNDGRDVLGIAGDGERVTELQADDACRQLHEAELAEEDFSSS